MTVRRSFFPEVVGAMARVPLTKGAFALIDLEDIKLVGQFPWVLQTGGGNKRTKYAACAMATEGKRRTVLLHRFLLRPPAGVLVDHVNRDTLDCRRGNLRLCTAAQNNWNRGANINNSHGHKGVTYDPRRNVWVARLFRGFKAVYLGSFQTADEAAAAYVAAAAKYHGAFAFDGSAVSSESGRGAE